MLPQNFFSLLNLEVVINDINDNQPLFPTRPVEVNVSESVSIGEAINLDQIQAQDLDIGMLSVKCALDIRFVANISIFVLKAWWLRVFYVTCDRGSQMGILVTLGVRDGVPKGIGIFLMMKF